MRFVLAVAISLSAISMGLAEPPSLQSATYLQIPSKATDLDVSPDGSKIMTVENDMVCVYYADGRRLASFGPVAHYARFCSDSQTVFCIGDAKKEGSLWNCDSGRRISDSDLRIANEYTMYKQWHFDGRRLARVVTSDRPEAFRIEVCTLPSQNERTYIYIPREMAHIVDELALSHDGKLLAIGFLVTRKISESPLRSTKNIREQLKIQIVEVASGQQLCEFIDDRSRMDSLRRWFVETVVFGNQNKSLIMSGRPSQYGETAGMVSMVQAFDVLSAKRQWITGSIAIVARDTVVSRDGNLIAIAGSSADEKASILDTKGRRHRNCVRLFEAASGTELARLFAEDLFITRMVFAPDAGKLFAISDNEDDFKIHCWDLSKVLPRR